MNIQFKIIYNDFGDYAVDLLNRNKFYISRHRKVTKKELNDIQMERGTNFCVFAFDDDVCVGMVGAYYISCQTVAKPYQIFMDTMLVDKLYNFNPIVLKGLLENAIRKIYEFGHTREIIAEVSPDNIASFRILRRYGFLILEDKTDFYGYIRLHNFIPSIVHFFDINLEEIISSKRLYNFLPKLKKMIIQNAVIIIKRIL